MPKEQHGLREEWIKLAPHWIAEARQGGDVPRKGMLDAYMLAACGDVQGMSILDSGCGEGRFCRMLAERGAGFVVGVDTCEPMIEAARELQSSKEEYILDVEANVQEVFRVLKDGGRFIIVNIHPMRSATGLWQRQPDGAKVHVILDDYFAEGERHFKMKGVEITNFHRTLATYVRGFLKAGFILEDIIEPTVSAEMVERYPELDDELRVPNFIIYILKKPQGALASL